MWDGNKGVTQLWSYGLGNKMVCNIMLEGAQM